MGNHEAADRFVPSALMSCPCVVKKEVPQHSDHLQVSISFEGETTLRTRPRLDQITPNTMEVVEDTAASSLFCLCSQPLVAKLGLQMSSAG